MRALAYIKLKLSVAAWRWYRCRHWNIDINVIKMAFRNFTVGGAWEMCASSEKLAKKYFFISIFCMVSRVLGVQFLTHIPKMSVRNNKNIYLVNKFALKSRFLWKIQEVTMRHLKLPRHNLSSEEEFSFILYDVTWWCALIVACEAVNYIVVQDNWLLFYDRSYLIWVNWAVWTHFLLLHCRRQTT